MKKSIVLAISILTAVTFAGCNVTVHTSPKATDDAAVEEVTDAAEEVVEEVVAENVPEDVPLDDMEPEEEYPSNEFEERVGKYSFDSYDEIVGLLEGEEAYAYVDVLGSDEPILLVTSYTFDNLDGNRAAIDATPYLKYPDGKYKAGSVMASGSTATPLALSDDGCIFIATHSTIEKDCLGDNGTDIPGIMVLKYAYVSYDDDLKPETYGGFLREENTVINNDGVQIAADDSKPYKDLFAEYETAQVINFTPIEIPEITE